MAEGPVRCWGHNRLGQLGQADGFWEDVGVRAEHMPPVNSMLGAAARENQVVLNLIGRKEHCISNRHAWHTWVWQTLAVLFPPPPPSPPLPPLAGLQVRVGWGYKCIQKNPALGGRKYVPLFATQDE
jgi:hypothetical protein